MLRINFRLNNLNTMALFSVSTFPTIFQCISLHTNDRAKIDVDNSENVIKGVDSNDRKAFL